MPDDDNSLSDNDGLPKEDIDTDVNRIKRRRTSSQPEMKEIHNTLTATSSSPSATSTSGASSR